MRKTRIIAVAAAALAALLVAVPGMASSSDANGDKLPDRWEKRHDLSLSVNQAPRDQDRDGLRNRGEFREGTDPRDADTDGDGAADGEASECDGRRGEGHRPPPPPEGEEEPPVG